MDSIIRAFRPGLRALRTLSSLQREAGENSETNQEDSKKAHQKSEVKSPYHHLTRSLPKVLPDLTSLDLQDTNDPFNALTDFDLRNLGDSYTKHLETLRKAQKLLRDNMPFEEIPEEAAPDLAAKIVRDIVSAEIWVAVGASGALIANEGLKKAVELILSRPNMLSEGLPAMYVYMILAIESAMIAKKKALGEDANPSVIRQAAAVATAGFVEMIVGTPLDLKALSSSFQHVKIAQHFTNPESLTALKTNHPKLFTKFIPEHLQSLPESELSKRTGQFTYNTTNIRAIYNLNPKLKISYNDIFKMGIAGSGFATARNVNLYLASHLVDQNGKDGKLSPVAILMITAFGAAATTPLNSAVYIAAEKIFKESIESATKNAAKESFSLPFKDPKTFATLVLLRTIATVFCAIAFSERSADYTNKIARKMFGIDIDEKTQKMIEEAAKSKEIKEEALKYLNPEAIKGMEEFARIVSLQEKGGNFSHLVKVGPFVPREALDEFEKLLRGNNSPSANFQPSSESSSRADTNAKETGSSKGRGE